MLLGRIYLHYTQGSSVEQLLVQLECLGDGHALLEAHVADTPVGNLADVFDLADAAEEIVQLVVGGFWERKLYKKS